MNIQLIHYNLALQTLIDLKLKNKITKFLKQNHSDKDTEYGGMLDKAKVLNFIQEDKGISKPSAYRHWENLDRLFIVKKKGKKLYVGI